MTITRCGPIGRKLRDGPTGLDMGQSTRENISGQGGWGVSNYDIVQYEEVIAGMAEQEGQGGGAPPPLPLCFEWGFTRTFPWNQDVAVK